MIQKVYVLPDENLEYLLFRLNCMVVNQVGESVVELDPALNTWMNKRRNFWLTYPYGVILLMLVIGLLSPAF